MSSSRGSSWEYDRYTQGSRMSGKREAGEREDNPPASGMNNGEPVLGGSELTEKFSPLQQAGLQRTTLHVFKGLYCTRRKVGMQEGGSRRHPSGRISCGPGATEPQVEELAKCVVHFWPQGYPQLTWELHVKGRTNHTLLRGRAMVSCGGIPQSPG